MEGAGGPSSGSSLTGEVILDRRMPTLCTFFWPDTYLSPLALCIALTGSSLWAGVDDHPEELSLLVPTSDRTTSRTSSLSSDSSNLRSPNPSDGGGDTPLAQSDEEDGDDGGAEPGPCS